MSRLVDLTREGTVFSFFPLSLSYGCFPQNPSFSVSHSVSLSHLVSSVLLFSPLTHISLRTTSSSGSG